MDNNQARDILYAICITLGFEVWEDFPLGTKEEILVEAEKAMQARELKAFLRGVRAARAAEGLDPDDIPEFKKDTVHISEIGTWPEDEIGISNLKTSSASLIHVSVPQAAKDNPRSIVEIIEDRIKRALNGENVGPTSGMTYDDVLPPPKR